jgi:hypothetical protein
MCAAGDTTSAVVPDQSALGKVVSLVLQRELAGLQSMAASVMTIAGDLLNVEKGVAAAYLPTIWGVKRPARPLAHLMDPLPMSEPLVSFGGAAAVR